MKEILISFIVFILVIIASCNSSIHETTYEVKFNDGTTILVVGYEVTTIGKHYVVKSVNNNSMFNKEEVQGIYPKEIGEIWNPINNKN